MVSPLSPSTRNNPFAPVAGSFRIPPIATDVEGRAIVKVDLSFTVSLLRIDTSVTPPVPSLLSENGEPPLTVPLYKRADIDRRALSTVTTRKTACGETTASICEPTLRTRPLLTKTLMLVSVVAATEPTAKTVLS